MSEEVKDQVENVEEQREYTEKELAEMRKAHETFYKTEIKRLKLEEEYHRLMADVEEHKARKMYNIIRLAQMVQGPQEEFPEEPEQEQPQEEPPVKRERKLAD